MLFPWDHNRASVGRERASASIHTAGTHALARALLGLLSARKRLHRSWAGCVKKAGNCRIQTSRADRVIRLMYLKCFQDPAPYFMFATAAFIQTVYKIQEKCYRNIKKTSGLDTVCPPHPSFGCHISLNYIRLCTWTIISAKINRKLQWKCFWKLWVVLQITNFAFIHNVLSLIRYILVRINRQTQEKKPVVLTGSAVTHDRPQKNKKCMNVKTFFIIIKSKIKRIAQTENAVSESKYFYTFLPSTQSWRELGLKKLSWKCLFMSPHTSRSPNRIKRNTE